VGTVRAELEKKSKVVDAPIAVVARVVVLSTVLLLTADTGAAWEKNAFVSELKRALS